MIGEGKYDDICTRAREQAQATAAIVIILEGNKGSGFSLQADMRVYETMTARLPALLRDMAAQIEKDLNAAEAAKDLAAEQAHEDTYAEYLRGD